VAGLVAPRVFDREGEKQAMSQHVPDTAAANAALDTAREPSRRDHLPYHAPRRPTGPTRQPPRRCST